MELGIILFLGGILVGMVIQAFRLGSVAIGTLMIVKDEEDKQYLFVELDKPLENIKWKRFAMMRVSQK